LARSFQGLEPAEPGFPRPGKPGVIYRHFDCPPAKPAGFFRSPSPFFRTVPRPVSRIQTPFSPFKTRGDLKIRFHDFSREWKKRALCPLQGFASGQNPPLFFKPCDLGGDLTHKEGK
jgi:hypothetical protein